MTMKIIARYLPQFHRTPENDAWWGAGFTEWTTVRGAKPLFAGHHQPMIPLDKNYYNLLEKDTMKWQSELAKKNGVDGFSFYHYWFHNGKKILEKPAENLLSWPEVDMPYCFTWANETWARTWRRFLESNVWVSKEETNFLPDDGDGVLLRQSYGNEEDWLLHIRYLLPFFRDPRYIRHENKPVFILFHPDTIYCWPDMRECWEKELKRAGLDGLYVIGEHQGDECVLSESIDARLWRFPDRVFSRIPPKAEGSLINGYDYDEYWQMVLQDDWSYQERKKAFYCVAPKFDTTPRHGSQGAVLIGASPQKFHNYFAALLQKCAAHHDEFVFVNAWNEWGEGAYLEPDEESGYAYLEAVKCAKESIIKKSQRSSKNDLSTERISSTSSVGTVDKGVLRAKRNFRMLDIWMTLREHGKSIADWLETQGIGTVAVYGAGYLGRHLLAELHNSHVKVLYVIDRRSVKIMPQYPLYRLDDELTTVDAIIVTPVGQYDAIRRSIREYTEYKTISLEHILTELL